MKMLKHWHDFGVFVVAEIDEPTNACSIEIVYPVHSFYDGDWHTSYYSKKEIGAISGHFIEFDGESSYDGYYEEFHDIIHQEVEARAFKSSVLTDRLAENNMFYRAGNTVRIKNTAELEESGMSEDEAAMLYSIAGKTFEIKEVIEDVENYVLSGERVEVCDADISSIVHPDLGW